MYKRQAQADLLVFAIEINDFCSDLLTYTQNIGGFLYMLLRDLRYMKQSVYARLQLNEMCIRDRPEPLQ